MGLPVPDLPDSPFARLARLASIILLHAGFVLLLAGGQEQQQAPKPVPKTVFVSFLTPEAPPMVQAPVEQPKPASQPPKPQPKPKPKPEPKAEVRPQPKPRPKPAPPPPVTLPPSEQAIADAPVPALESPAPPPTAASAAAPAPAAPAAPAQPRPAVPPEPRTLSSGVRYLQPPEPEYPALSRRLGEEGKAVLRVLVNERGRPERAEIEVSSGAPRLDEAARRAALRAVFKPHIEDGRPVSVYAIVPIRFQLDS
jgi:protein TonB